MASTAEVLSYQELSRYNLTNLIKAQYEAGQPLDEKFIKNIDFTEKGDKTFWLNDKSGKQQRYDVKESLALNCVNYLPLVYYQEYITPEWINTEGQEYNMVNGALGAKKYDFLHYLRKVTSEYLETIYAQALGNGAKEEKEKIRAYLNVYENKFLNPILNIAHNVSNLGLVNANSDLYEKYYDLFKAVLPDLDRYMQYKEETFAYKKDQHKEINADNWVKNYAQIKWCGHKMGELKDLISELINNKNLYYFL
jgi:hypothetical protein